MRIGIVGGGSVGQTLGAGFAKAGHEVVLGIREVTPETLAQPRNQARTLAEWQDETGARVVTMEEAAWRGEAVVNATNGAGSLEALRIAGTRNLAGKVLIDVANPLDFSKGMPPFLMAEYSGPTSLGEQVQAAFPEARVVKCFNTVTASVMTNPGLVPGEHDLFLCGDDEAAKEAVRELARGFGWSRFVDLGDIKGARAQEMFVVIWVRLWMVSGDPIFGYRIVR
ncbi:NADP oxidoreductase, coenzyme F420-dependent [Rubellimicrobium mesophilum DSM 19309]|uniref:NADP oxidoreductase, coenzyme F420-dependent n=1 Tax=Rubellimicrobium mesophilum DSM 19309 TaxID=442562 RepID=A0A017HVV6_9RHOB|nr:NAD(P)-binding domain-containing protein [Rubellimicrobium mesophilum]EYD78303.1 NADP oxidoreductase, coenzyme F420-dependent [Rubellimicrobium mesophilum DSM 19309]